MKDAPEDTQAAIKALLNPNHTVRKQEYDSLVNKFRNEPLNPPQQAFSRLYDRTVVTCKLTFFTPAAPIPASERTKQLEREQEELESKVDVRRTMSTPKQRS